MAEHALDPRTARRLVLDLERRVGLAWPDWTNVNKGDPGVTLLQLFTLLAEPLIVHSEPIPREARSRLHAAIDRMHGWLEATPSVDVAVDDEPWRQVEHLAGATPDDRVYIARLDDQGNATIEFGDGRTGRRPPAGTRVTATYRTGAGGPSVTARVRWPAESPPAVTIEWDHAIRFCRAAAHTAAR
jgi:hypothetical protein